MPRLGSSCDENGDGGDGASDQASDISGGVVGSNLVVADRVLIWLSEPSCRPDFTNTSLCYTETWEFFRHIHPTQHIWLGKAGKEGPPLVWKEITLHMTVIFFLFK